MLKQILKNRLLEERQMRRDLATIEGDIQLSEIQRDENQTINKNDEQSSTSLNMTNK